jgi:hypothetical protein
MRLGYAPVISLLLVVQVPNASDMGSMAVLLRPLDGFPLRLEAGEDVVGMILDNIMVPLVAALGRGSI